MGKTRWTPEEDKLLSDCIKEHKTGKWKQVPKMAGLSRGHHACRLRWTYYLAPDINREDLTSEEKKFIIKAHSDLGNKWAQIARQQQLERRTGNCIKNYWKTKAREKKIREMEEQIFNNLDDIIHDLEDWV